MKILIVRHGEPDYSIDSLTEKGWREAALLADRLVKESADGYFVSPLGRAKDTARDTLRRLGREAEVLDWLEEFRGWFVDPCKSRRTHAWDLMPQYWTRCRELLDLDAWRDNPLVATGNSAAIYDETAAGLDALLARYGYERDGAIYRTQENTNKTIVLFCHFGVASAMLSHLLRIPLYPLLHGFIMAPSSVTTLVSEERLQGEVWFRCTALGDTSHLYVAGEPISHYGRFLEQYGVEDGLGGKP